MAVSRDEKNKDEDCKENNKVTKKSIFAHFVITLSPLSSPCEWQLKLK